MEKFRRPCTLCGMLLSLAATVLALAQAPTPAQAPPPPVMPNVDERVVVTATAAPASPRALGRAVTVLTRDDLERYGGGSIVDALRLAPAVDVRARGDRGMQADFVVRGASFGQTLVLVDGVRLNDAQSGHHNADFPVSAASIERIEIVAGASSASHGADAFGGAVHLITRTGAYAEATVAAGSFDTARLDAAVGGLPGGLSVSLWGSRSTGFMFDRGHGAGGARISAAPASGTRLAAAHVRKAFGANGFYGPSPSKEWTDLTMAGGSFARARGAWLFDVRGAYRSHGDRFRWDIARPGFAENVHRTHAADMTARADRQMGRARVTAGASSGADWIDSSNLGTHRQTRAAIFGEAQVALGARAALQPAARVDHYSTFGTALSPSVALSVWPSERWRVRASAGRAFRAPTYTERFYSDPAHLADAALEPEDGWSAEAGADLHAGPWTLTASAFRRWDRNVIDWVRASASERWRTTNVRDVGTAGVELEAARAFTRGSIGVSYAALDTSAPSLALLSKYVLDYTRHAIGARAALDAAGLSLSLRIDHRRRSDAQRYTLADARVGRRVGAFVLFVEGANLLAERYTEIAGVAMPGRSAMAGATLRR